MFVHENRVQFPARKAGARDAHQTRGFVRTPRRGRREAPPPRARSRRRAFPARSASQIGRLTGTSVTSSTPLSMRMREPTARDRGAAGRLRQEPAPDPPRDPASIDDRAGEGQPGSRAAGVPRDEQLPAPGRCRDLSVTPARLQARVHFELEFAPSPRHRAGTRSCRSPISALVAAAIPPAPTVAHRRVRREGLSSMSFWCSRCTDIALEQLHTLPCCRRKTWISSGADVHQA